VLINLTFYCVEDEGTVIPISINIPSTTKNDYDGAYVHCTRHCVATAYSRLQYCKI